MFREPIDEPEYINPTIPANDIVTRLLPFIHDEMRMPAGLIMDTIKEIERLQAELKDSDDDFHALKSMFDNMRAERDRWFKIARDLYVWSIGILGDHMTTAEVQAYEQAVRGE